METRRRPLVHVAILVVALGLIGWLIARSVAKQRLLRALESNNMAVRVEAARKLLEAGKLIDALPAQPVIRRSKAAQALGEIGTEEALDALAVILADQEEAPRRWARQALVKIGRRAIPVFMNALAAGGGTREEAITGLVALAQRNNFQDAAAVAAPVRFLLTDRAALPGAAAALSQLGEVGIKALVDACYVVDGTLRQQALNNLGKQRIKAAVPAALFNLQPGQTLAIGNAITALGLIGDRTAVPAIIPFLKNPDYRQAAATALGLLRDPRAVDPLLATLTDTEKAYRDAAILALRRIGEPAVPALMRELRSPNVLLRRAAASGMIGIGSPAANQALAQALLNDPDEEVRVEAALALGWKGNVAAVGPLVEAVSRPGQPWRVVDAAVKGLSEIGPAAIPSLISVLNRPALTVELGYHIASALAGMGRPVVPTLITYLGSGSPAVQKWVAVALGEIGDPRAVEPLRSLEARASGDLKWVAKEQVRVLSGLGGS